MLFFDNDDADIVAAPITTRLREGRFHVPVTDLDAAGLLKPSIVRLHKLTNVERTLVGARLGALGQTDHERLAAVRHAFCTTVGASLRL